jgi:ATP-binding cassette subfamily F protein 3
VRGGRLTHYPGGYDYYLEKTRQADRAGLTGGGSANPPGPPASENKASADARTRKELKRQQAELRQARSRERRELQSRVTALENEIAEIESREKDLVVELEQPETYAITGRAVEVNRELKMIHERLPQLHADWERAAQALQEWDGDA